MIIFSLGGSLIVPDEIDVEFLKRFKEIILKSDERFALICGGGKICRRYQEAASKISDLNNEDLDWLGIASTKLNAFLIKTIFKGYAYPEVIDDPTQPVDFKEKVIVAAGWKPGCSTDKDAVLLAKNLGAKTVVNLSNIDYVYDKDPKKFDDAKPLKRISWNDFQNIVGEKWDPGLNAPFDPVASKEAKELGLKVVILNGKNIRNIEDYLAGKDFVGTIIE